ncbi:sensor histidine kinase [Paenibacillus taiwanensis]|uniref:sensor histidine kinase n=1 Tax=Paenibacillus taiwanensis TaxID=401638 RepID=UPI001FE00BC0|nr:sensor histidine kinase [Paenibacillus taiwanensis]
MWMQFLLRYSFTLVPFVYVLYSDTFLYRGNDVQQYMFAGLLIMGLTEFRRAWGGPHVQWLLFLCELVTAGWLTYTHSGILGFLMMASILSLPAPVSRTMAFSGCIAAWLGLNIALLPHESIWYAVMNICMLVVVAFVIHTFYQQLQHNMMMNNNDDLRRQTYELMQARQEVIQYARMVEHTAQVEERNRIAHDLHDELGHQLVRLKMMMDASVEVSRLNPEHARKLFSEVRDQLSGCMELMRSTVKRMKPSDANMRAYSLEKLALDSEHANLRITYQIAGIPYTLYPSIEITLFRNAQEAITNAVRHGGATEVHLMLRYEPDRLVLEVSNNGQIPEASIAAGMGIRGMRDRAAALNGQVETSFKPAFMVRTIVPLHAAGPVEQTL